MSDPGSQEQLIAQLQVSEKLCAELKDKNKSLENEVAQLHNQLDMKASQM